jgi:hypothetical protein
MLTANTALSFTLQCAATAVLPGEYTCLIQRTALEQKNRGSCTTKLAQYATAHMRL